MIISGNRLKNNTVDLLLSNYMKVILLKKISQLGKAGDIKDVADGYARNFLLPRGLAELATDQTVQTLVANQKQLARQAEHDLLLAEKNAARLNGLAIEISGRTNDQGKLYAAVTATAVAKKLKERGFNIDKKQLQLPEPIKEPGEYPLMVNLEHGLEAEIMLIVLD